MMRNSFKESYYHLFQKQFNFFHYNKYQRWESNPHTGVHEFESCASTYSATLTIIKQIPNLDSASDDFIDALQVQLSSCWVLGCIRHLTDLFFVIGVGIEPTQKDGPFISHTR